MPLSGGVRFATMTAQRVLVIGATGLIGRPVTEALVNDGFDERALVRDRRRAMAALPTGCELVRGDLSDPESIQHALTGMDAVYLSLSSPTSKHRPAWSPEFEGTRTVVNAMKNAGVNRILRLSAMGVDANDDWWESREKARTDQAVLDSGLQATIFRPTWFMESIPASVIGPLLPVLRGPDDPLYWIAGHDYGQQVAAALRDESTAGTIYDVQGPEGASMTEAYKRFGAVWKQYLWMVPFPIAMFKAMRPMSPMADFMTELMDMTFTRVVKMPAETNAHTLHRPTITIEQFAEELLQRNELPKMRS